MRLVIGGAFQGKRRFVTKVLNVPETAIVDGELPEEAAVWAVDHYHLLLRRQVAAGVDPIDALRRAIDKNPTLILICDEIGMGVVPMEAEERAWREAVGRTLCFAAAEAEEVWRVLCGIGKRLK